jgi:rhodanese-related sulfurtransferase
MKRPIVQAIIIILVSMALAIAANALASRERKVTLVGWYPNAQKVPHEEPAPPARISQPVPVVAPAPTPAPIAETVAPAPVPQPTPAPQPVKPAPKTATPNAERPTPKASDVLARFQQHPDKPYIEIAFDDVKALHDKGVLFLDARRTSVYEQGHIAGARPFSVWESDIDDKTRKLFDERSDPDSQALPIVVYCSGGECEDSHMLAQKLWGIQFNNVYVYKDGFPDWQKHGGAIHTGAQP